MQGVYTLHASIPEGLARPTILPDHSHPHRARMPPPLGGARRQHTHRAHTNPTCKGPVHRPSLSPRHPHRQVRLHSRRGPATLARKGPRHTHGQPGDPAGRGGGAGRDGLGGGRPLPRRPGRPPSCLPRPPRDLRPTRPVGRSPRGPLQDRAAPAPGSPQPPPSGPRREAGQAGYLRSPWLRWRWRVRTARGSRTLLAGRAGGAAAPVSRRRRRVPGPAECRRGAPAR